MAAMLLSKSTFFNLPTAFPRSHSLSDRSPHKVSRVCFTSASKNSEGRNVFEETRDSRAWAQEQAQETKKKTEEVAGSMVDKAKDGTYRTAEGVKEYASDAKVKTNDLAGSVADKAKEGTNKAAEIAEGAKESAKENFQGVKEKTEGIAETVAKKTEETVQNVEENTEKTVKSAWGAANETGQKIKETVLGTTDEIGDKK